MMKVSVTGPTASGKTYHAKRLAERLDIPYVSASCHLLELAGVREEGHFWIQEGERALRKRRLLDPRLDELTNERILGLARVSEGVYDAWALPFMYEGCDLFRIRLEPDLDARARIALASKEEQPFSLDELKERILEKDRIAYELMLRVGVDIRARIPYDLVLDNSSLMPHETEKLLYDALMKDASRRSQATAR